MKENTFLADVLDNGKLKYRDTDRERGLRLLDSMRGKCIEITFVQHHEPPAATATRKPTRKGR